MKKMDSTLLDQRSAALTVRKEILTCLFQTGGGHYGGALSVVDILLVLARDVVKLQPNNVRSSKRDRLILSKGHAAVALYAVYQHLGLLAGIDLANYGAFGLSLEGHPDMLVTEGVDFSSGSLGQGVSAGMGMAFVLRDVGAHIWVVLGDGECQEGQIWEAALLASRYKLANLHVIIDSNGAQEIGWQHDATLPQEPIPNLAGKWASFGWIVHEIDGHDSCELTNMCNSLKSETRGPSVVIAKTRKGKGVKRIEDDPVRYHCVTVDNPEHEELMSDLYA
jgi:transketolase